MNLKELKPHIHFKRTSPTEGIIYTDLKYSPYIETNMSSKEQYKDALKAKTRIITEQIKKIAKLEMELSSAYEAVDLLKEALDMRGKSLKERSLLRKKKFWQFWK